MNDESRNSQPTSDVDAIVTDLKSLYEHVGVAIGKRSAEAQATWRDTRAKLEAKRAVLETRARELSIKGSAASAELKSGFNAALTELKRAFNEASTKFRE